MTGNHRKKLTETELKELKLRAGKIIPLRVAYYAAEEGFEYNRVTVRAQRTRWGSCSSKGNLNFNCLLVLAPPQVLDAIVVHELCHLRHMDHSREFYGEVLRIYPEYRKWHKWLKDNGRELIEMLPESAAAGGKSRSRSAFAGRSLWRRAGRKRSARD